MPKPKNTIEGLEPRVRDMLKNHPSNWVETAYYFLRQTAQGPSPQDTISREWLDDNYLIDKPGQYIRTESDKLRGLESLKKRLDAIAERLGQI